LPSAKLVLDIQPSRPWDDVDVNRQSWITHALRRWTVAGPE